LLLNKNSSHWAAVLEDIVKNIPEGITISKMDLKENGNVSLSGHVDLREQLLNFKTNLESSKYIVSVSLPFSDLTSRMDIDFNLSFILKEGALRGN